jgi:hypothetical protein
LKRYILFALFFIFCSFLRAQRIPQYNISVTLNERDNSLDGNLTVEYTNNSKDSIHFLWFNIYPNAFKSDRTAFSEYMLDKGNTAFYFSDQSQKGYINRLDFRSGDNILKTEDHPLYIDIIKVIFEEALAPGGSKKITTPFHVKLPYNFDGIGYKGLQYDLKFWYPAVAEYIKPLTNADSSSNVPGDYSVNLSVNARFSVASPYVEKQPAPEPTANPDALKILSFNVSAAKDIPITIVKPQSPKISSVKSAAAEHDIFKFLSGSSRNISNPSKKDSLLNNKIRKLFSHPILPAIGYNEYDGLQLGVLSHNYYKQKSVSYYLAPVYTFKSKTIAGIAGASYRIQPKKYVNEIEAGFTASSFSYDDGVDANNEKVFANLFKIVPFIKVKLLSRVPIVEKTLTFKTYIINERDLEFVRDSVGPVFRQEEGEYATRFVNELTFDYSSDRVLYPYRAQLQVQQGLTWYRVNATGNYFFNYPNGGGMNVRVFAAKFGYIGNLSSSERFRNLRYMPKLTAVRGSEDYTYSNYFIGRNNFDGFASRQIMMRDGGLKLRTDLFEGLQGRSDNWIASLNVSTSFPQILPVKVPLKIFVDAGSYSEAWDEDNNNPRFLYVAGLQISLFKDVLNIYAPLLYSKQFRDQLKTVPEENKFFKKVSFSVDLQKIDVRKLF